MKTKYLYLFIASLCLIFISEFAFAQESAFMISINTQPEDADISIDGKIMIKDNGFIYLPKGKYHLKITAYGYLSFETTIKISRKSTTFNFGLKEDPSLAIQVSSESDAVPDQEQIQEHEQEQVSEQIREENRQVTTYEVIETPVRPNINMADYSFEIDMQFVKGGHFLMGYSRSTVKMKPHDVILSDFSIAKYETTQKQWISIMGSNPSKNIGDQNPVDNVSWDDVQVFIAKLNTQTGKEYRLPTEAEWEYAARGGANYDSENPEKYSGSNTIDDVAWFWRNSGDVYLTGRFDNESTKINNCTTKTVGQKESNSLDLYDMTGNVWEWCSDWYSEDYYVYSSKSNPLGPGGGKTRVSRGGGFVSKQKYCPVYFRFSGVPKFGYNYSGFRLVLSE